MYIYMKIKRKLFKIGDSLAIVITKPVSELLDLKVGDWVEFDNLTKYKEVKK